MADYNKELSKVRGPFRVYPKKKKEEPISTLDDYQKAFIQGLEVYDVRQKKPVRWNFLKDSEGLLNLGLTLSPELRMMMAAGLARKGKKIIDPIKFNREGKMSERDDRGNQYLQ